MFGFIDLLAVKEGEILAVQTTTASNMSARANKIADSEHVGMVRKSGMKIHIHGWIKIGRKWECKIMDVS
jgi:hypothetical protein